MEPRPHPAPPLFGGTLLVTPDGFAVTSDPERDRIWVARFDPPAIVRELVLEPLDEPGLLARSEDGRVHVVLRRGGALVSFRPDDDEPASRRSVCPSPRGVAARGVELVVACAGGELVRLPSRGAAMDVRRVGPDLRDVGFEADGSIWATRFRSARMVRWVGDDVREVEIPTITRAAGVYTSAPFGAGVAWRTIAMSDGTQVERSSRTPGRSARAATPGRGAPTAAPTTSAPAVASRRRR